MPIEIDIMENKVIGPLIAAEFKRGSEEGERKGLQEGKLEGLQEGERKVLRRLIEMRFGPLPGWAEQRLASRSAAELEELSVRVLESQSIEDVLK